jgi:hypothetical protein
MSALLFIQDKRRTVERIEFVSSLRMAMNAKSDSLKKQMEAWARHAEIDLYFDG